LCDIYNKLFSMAGEDKKITEGYNYTAPIDNTRVANDNDLKKLSTSLADNSQNKKNSQYTSKVKLESKTPAPNVSNSGLLTEKNAERLDEAGNYINNLANFLSEYYAEINNCFRKSINGWYNSHIASSDGPWYFPNSKIDSDALNNYHPEAARRVFKEIPKGILADIYKSCETKKVKPTQQQPVQYIYEQGNDTIIAPFDRRLDRINVDVNNTGHLEIPFDTRFRDSATSGLVISEELITNNENLTNKDSIINNLRKNKKRLQNDKSNIGVKSLVNTYSVTKLYGSHGGEYLVDRKGERKWYEIDGTNDDIINYSKNPTTTSIINWGEGDPYGRTPYQFTDFVFAKYWNKIPNNRLITLRRYPAPIIDNLKFPGMDGFVDPGSQSPDNKNDPDNKSSYANEPGEKTGVKQGGSPEGGSGKRIMFPPMATAVTYFGGDTGNSLKDMLKFTTGLKWDEVTAKVFDVTAQQVPTNEDGPGGMLYKGLTDLAKTVNIATGNFDDKLIMNGGLLPPDPYTDGPYTNRIIGPVNVIDSVKKRARGLEFSNNINLSFEYVARPIGGVNTKAALLDIISNFMIISSASAMFWGGQHRFMSAPAKYPFMGGNKGMQEWYSGKPTAWASTTMKDMIHKTGSGGGIIDMTKDFFKNLFSGNFAAGLGDEAKKLNGDKKGKGIVTNLAKHYIAKNSNGQIPYLSGLKALLIGEPVGEWHLTIGNPLNPIAMIGNLISKNLTLEFGEELGPDDFPLEVKISVTLEHGMARDRDAIESVFNRGMGRIYDMPDNFKGSADFETRVDKNTGNQTKEGSQPTAKSRWSAQTLYQKGMDSTNMGDSGSRDNAMHSGMSVWNRTSFQALSANQDLNFNSSKNIWSRSEFRSDEWITKKSLT